MEDLTPPDAAPRRRVAVVTGASSGIGLAAAVELARRGYRLALVGRDQARLAAATDRVGAATRDVDQAPAAAPAAAQAGTAATAGDRAGAGVAADRVAAFRADFAVLAQVRELAERLSSAYDRIDLLASNAGGLMPRRVTTVDGFELTMQTNHLAPFLLANLLHDRVGRLVTTASRAHQQGRLDPDDLSSRRQAYLPLRVYGSAKQANILFAAEAARRWPDLLSVSYHPGVVRTRFGTGSPLVSAYFRYAPWLRSPARGARTLVWLAEAPRAELVNGGYYHDERLDRPGRTAADADLAARLWEASRQAVGLG